MIFQHIVQLQLSLMTASAELKALHRAVDVHYQQNGERNRDILNALRDENLSYAERLDLIASLLEVSNEERESLFPING